MTKYQRKPIVVEAVTFDEFVEHGKKNCVTTHNGLPWTFSYCGHPVTHENDDRYLIMTPGHMLVFERGDILVTDEAGGIYPYKADVFASTFDRLDTTEQAVNEK